MLTRLVRTAHLADDRFAVRPAVDAFPGAAPLLERFLADEAGHDALIADSLSHLA